MQNLLAYTAAAGMLVSAFFIIRPDPDVPPFASRFRAGNILLALFWTTVLAQTWKVLQPVHMMLLAWMAAISWSALFLIWPQPGIPPFSNRWRAAGALLALLTSLLPLACAFIGRFDMVIITSWMGLMAWPLAFVVRPDAKNPLIATRLRAAGVFVAALVLFPVAIVAGSLVGQAQRDAGFWPEGQPTAAP